MRVADLEEVEVMTHGGAAPYDRSLEADPQIAGRTRAENTQALYGRGAKLTRSTMATQVIAVGDGSLDIRKGAKAKGRKRSGQAARVAPGARKPRASEVVDRVEMVPAEASTSAPVAVAPVSEILVPEPQVEARAEAVREPEVLAPRVILPALSREMSDVLGDVDRPEEDQMGQVEAGTITDKVLDVFSPEILAERAKRRDPRRLPAGYDPSWADSWVRDPIAPLPEMVREFITFGTAVDKRPEELTDEEARLLAGPGMFPMPLGFNPNDYKDRRPPRFFTREKDVPSFEWEAEITRAGGTMQKLVASNALYIDEFREIERSRIRMWPYAVARRDFIKGLMDGLAVGELTFEPVSMAEDDLLRSVRWRVFASADHNWLQMIPNADLDLYYTRILDKLSWPAGLSRLELLQRFGQGDDLTNPPNMSSQGRPPRWLLPDQDWIEGEGFGIHAADGTLIEIPSSGFELAEDFGTTDDMAPVTRDPSIDPKAWG
ncbi:hypothetical protein [Methylorubrum aminovorans]|uniref:hypothetical protein n=1 Tax=Methylorubrum aminovorans TaxID=269069 RepID=UPI001EE1070A|nr:hypothetical protein [Methylorubrum aminovorans]